MLRMVRIFLDYLRICRPTTLVLLGYASYIVAGWIVLCLPFAAERPGIGALEHLFTAVSAVSTTGLVTVDPGASYSTLGEIAILAMIQLGGAGYMTIGSFIVLSQRKPLSDLRKSISNHTFSLPRGYNIESFLKQVIVFTLIVESLGAAALYLAFRHAGLESPLWPAIFHSVSSFCTAGFSLFATSLEAYRGDFWINAIVAALSYLGAVGFIVMADLWRVVSKQQQSITFTSRIILHVTAWLSIGGTLLLLVTEPSLHALSAHERILAAFFQAMTAMTTVGFNTVPIAGLAQGPLVLVVLLMICGASPSGTGGGIKSTTLSALYGQAKSAILGHEGPYFLGRPIPYDRMRTATAHFVLYLATLGSGVLALAMLEEQPFLTLLFEAASAIGTVGLSMGITAQLVPLSKLVVIALMFCGRVGPLLVGAALFLPRQALDPSKDTDVAV